jgi:hypothetical protein
VHCTAHLAEELGKEHFLWANSYLDEYTGWSAGGRGICSLSPQPKKGELFKPVSSAGYIFYNLQTLNTRPWTTLKDRVTLDS